MPLTVWDRPSGYNFGTFSERSTINLSLTQLSAENVNFKVISGKLPRGLRISGSNIIGTPFEVTRTTEYKFVIRASTEDELSDRTFYITIEGSDEPRWLTPAGLLPVGTNQAYYIIDSTFVDFQLVASDTDTAAGQQLNFFIASGEGELPPGLRLLSNGRITGFIQPLLEVPKKGDNGFYDSGLFDSSGYDFGYRPTNGYDTYVFDLVTYDFSVETLRPRKLNRNYEFIATITDGDTVTKRRFRIYVVGDDFFSADNVIMQAGQGTYTADVTYIQIPIFTTPKYLGLRRANNYQTFKIDIYEGEGVPLNPVVYQLSPNNAMISGLCEKELTTDNRLGSNKIRFVKSSGVPEIGYVVNFNQELSNSTNTTYTITDVDPLGGNIYRLTLDKALDITLPNMTPIYTGTPSELPPGMQFDAGTGEVFGVVPYQPAVTKTYNFTIKAIRFGTGTETNISRRMFTVDILGEIDSTINWTVEKDLGVINTGYSSDLFVNAVTTYKNSLIYYKVEEGILPPGLNLNLDGEIVGKVNQPRDQNTYKGLWNSSTTYNKKNIIKRNRSFEIQSVSRRKNVSTLVTKEINDFKNNEIIKIFSDKPNFNYSDGVEIIIDTLKINSVNSIVELTPTNFLVNLSIPAQKVPLLAPVFTNVKGFSNNVDPFNNIEVEVKSTTGTGTGAKFLISKGTNGLPSYTGLVGTNNNPIIVLDPGTGYMPGDKITISGSNFPGNVDGLNDLTFTLFNGLSFYYKINGNSNENYNGIFISTSSTTTSLTLLFDMDPGLFGNNLISQQTGLTTYEAQTQLVPLNYFYYNNTNNNQNVLKATGKVIGKPSFYKSKIDNNISTTFNVSNWNLYKFPINEQTPTSYDKLSTTFDNLETTVDRSYTFKIKASDQLAYTSIVETFTLKINVPLNGYYSNITARPFLKQYQREMFKNFINDNSIFNPNLIYRLGDKNFGVQRDLKSLIYAGIETKEALDYVIAMSQNNKPKRFKFGNVKKAIAKVTGSEETIYEVIYIELLDPLEKGKKHLPFKIKTSPSTFNLTVDNNNEFYEGPFTLDSQTWHRPNPFYASIDRTDVIAGDSGTGVKFPSSISIWRKRLKNMPDTKNERNYLPLWMRSIQPGTYVELDFVAAVPLCFCKPGSADDILLNIKNSKFDFKLLEYFVDRYIIDSIEGYYEDKYLAFRNDRTTI